MNHAATNTAENRPSWFERVKDVRRVIRIEIAESAIRNPQSAIRNPQLS
jgi:hypothetical protein